MSVPSQQGIFGWADSVDKDDTTPALPAGWWRHKATEVSFGGIQDLRTFPPEVGGELTPTGAYKNGEYVGGGVTLQPRIQETFGRLLKSMMGSVAGVPTGTVLLGYKHVFQMAAQQNLMGWLALRKWIPGDTVATSIGELMTGVRISGARITIPASGIVTARIEFQGRKAAMAKNPGWDLDAAWGNLFEDTTSVPLPSAVGGLVQLPTGTPATVTSLIVNWANNESTPEQERIVGSPYPDDVIALTRAASIQATVKWKDGDLFSRIYNGAAAAGPGMVSWVAQPFTSSFLATVLGPNDIPGTTPGAQKYQLDITADNVMWNVNGPITLAGADLVMMPIIGTVIRAPINPYMTFALYNAKATSY